MNNLSFEKYRGMELKSDGSLFGLDILSALKLCRCPYCNCKLYAMMNKPYFWCKSTKHKQKFIVHRDKILLDK